jgi:Xaa-Pro aminopeptidase
MSEYVAGCYGRREFISGFTGSAGSALVTLDQALCWTDGRYFVQAEQELDSGVWTLMKQGKECLTMEQWLADNLGEEYPGTTSSENSAGGGRKKRRKVGVDPLLLQECLASSYTKLFESRNLELVGVEDNLVDLVWGDERPPAPSGVAFQLGVERTGKTTATKLRELRDKMEQCKAELIVLSALVRPIPNPNPIPNPIPIPIPIPTPIPTPISFLPSFLLSLLVRLVYDTHTHARWS